MQASPLEDIQRRIAGLADGPVKTIEVPVARACGRVLAEAVKGPGLGLGTVLGTIHVATLAGLGLSTVRVFERARVGIVSLTRRSRPSTVATATLSAAVEQMGAKAFASMCRSDDEACLVRSVGMFAAECALVLVIGFPGEDRIDALKRAGLSCDASGIRAFGLAPYGEVRIARVGHAHMVALPEAPADALVAFATLVSPLLRALSGRSDVLSRLHAATRVGDDGAAALAAWLG